MRRVKFVVLLLIVFTAFLPAHCHAAAKPSYNAEYKSKILSKVIPTNTIATIKSDSSIREAPFYFAQPICELKRGASVEVLRDASEKWYMVESDDENASGWLPAKVIDIQAAQTPWLPEMTSEELEAFANIMDFPTDTGLFIWTDIARQKTHVFNKNACFKLVRTFDCSSGKDSSPTTRGFFSIKGRGEWFYSRRLAGGGMYWVRFNDSYLFHSYKMDRSKNVTDDILGERRSSGCVRLSTEDAKWIYENIPDGSTVFIY